MWYTKVVVVWLLCFQLLFSSILYAQELPFSYNYKRRIDFIEKVVTPSLKGVQNSFLLTFAVTSAERLISLVPQIAALPFLTQILGPLAMMQLGAGQILRGTAAQYRIRHRNDDVREVTFEKLSLLKAFFSNSELYWFWRNLRGAKIINKSNRIKKHLDREKFEKTFYDYFSRIKRRIPKKDEKKMFHAFLKTLSFVHLDCDKNTLKALSDLGVIDGYGHLKENKKSSFDILAKLQKLNLTFIQKRQLLHQLGYLHPEDISQLEKHFGFSMRILLSKRMQNDKEVQQALDSLWLNEKNILSENKLFKRKLAIVKMKQGKYPKYHLLTLEREMMNFKKEVIKGIHQFEIDNQALTIKKFPKMDALGSGLQYVGGVGFITSASLALLNTLIPLSQAASTALSFTGVGSILGLSSVSLLSLGMLRLSQDIPSYLHVRSDQKIIKQLVTHLQSVQEKFALSEQEKNLLILKEFELKTALILKQQKKKALLYKLAMDSTFLSIGAAATSMGILTLLVLTGVISASGYGAPIAMGVDILLIAAIIPMTTFSLLYLRQQHKNKKIENLIQYLRSHIEHNFNPKDVAIFNEVLKKNKDHLLKLGIAKMDLHKDRYQFAQKKYGNFYQRFLYKRHHLLYRDVMKHKKKMRKQAKSLLKKNGLLPLQGLFEIKSADIHIHRDVFDSFELLEGMKNSTSPLPRQIPSWNLKKSNQHNLAKALSHFMYTFILLKENTFEFSLYKKDQAFIEKHHLLLNSKEKNEYKKKLTHKFQHNKKEMLIHLKKWEKIMSQKVKGVNKNYIHHLSHEIKSMISLSERAPKKLDLKDFKRVEEYLLLYIPYEYL